MELVMVLLLAQVDGQVFESRVDGPRATLLTFEKP
jgi:hypothetical protein